MSRGKAAHTLALIDAAAAILRQIQPATIRSVCYQLFIRGLLAGMEKKNTNRVSTQLVWAREQEIVPWSHVVDETREAERVATWNNPDEIVRAAVNGYRRDYWQDQPERVEIWSEKGTVRGTLAPVLQKYGVTFRVAHGYQSATALYDMANESRGSEKPLTIFYVGDRDPSGMHMSEVDLPNRLIDRYGGELVIQRIALDASDCTADLPSFSVTDKERDPRYRWYVDRYGQRCWELDALSPVVLRERVESHILGKLDLDAWERAIAVEQAEVESMHGFLRDWNSKSGPASKYSGGDRA